MLRPFLAIGQKLFGQTPILVFVSAVGPALGMVPGEKIPVVWGIAYAAMAYNVGIVYRAEFLWSGVLIFAGSLLALAEGSPQVRRLKGPDATDLKKSVVYRALPEWVGAKLNQGAALDARDEDPIYEQQ